MIMSAQTYRRQTYGGLSAYVTAKTAGRVAPYTPLLKQAFPKKM